MFSARLFCIFADQCANSQWRLPRKKTHIFTCRVGSTDGSFARKPSLKRLASAVCPSPLTYARQRPITASQSIRYDMLVIILPRYQYGPLLFFLLQKLCQITWLLTGWKNFLYFRRPPWGPRPVAFATSATWLIRHWGHNVATFQQQRLHFWNIIDTVNG